MAFPFKKYSSESSLGHDKSLMLCTSGHFAFIKHYGDKMGTNINRIHYKLAQIHRGEKWYVYYSFKNPDTGKFLRIKIYKDINRYKGEEREEHAALLVTAINEWLKDGGNPFEVEEQKQSWSFIEGLNYFKQKIPEMGLRPKSVSDYSSFIETFTSHTTKYHQKPINAITKAEALNMLLKMKEERKWGNRTYNNHITLCRVVFNYLSQHSITEVNPFKEVKPLKETSTKHRPFTKSEWEAIKEKAPIDLLTFILFLYYSGTRPNEARQLKHEHLLRERGLLLIPGNISKNRQDGYVPVPDQLFNLVKGDGLIFGMSRNYYGAKFTKLKKQLKLSSDHTLYSIKATRAIHLADDGASPYAIQALFRHSSLDMTMIYLRGLGVNVGREVADKARNL